MGLVPEGEPSRLDSVSLRKLDLARAVGLGLALGRALGLGPLSPRPLGPRSEPLGLGPGRTEGTSPGLVSGDPPRKATLTAFAHWVSARRSGFRFPSIPCLRSVNPFAISAMA